MLEKKRKPPIPASWESEGRLLMPPFWEHLQPLSIRIAQPTNQTLSSSKVWRSGLTLLGNDVWKCLGSPFFFLPPALFDVEAFWSIAAPIFVGKGRGYATTITVVDALLVCEPAFRTLQGRAVIRKESKKT